MNVMKAFRLSNRALTRGDLGVEIEVEGNNLPQPDKYWNCELDGSLRGESMEYVLSKPLGMAATRSALSHLNASYLANDTVVHESVRAGVHVHVNVQQLSTVELFSFMTAYIVLEDLLIKYCGEYREGNLFCLRIKDAEYLLHTIEEVARTKDYQLFNRDVLRYSSMNVCSLWRYGSLEFRAMRGTRDLDAIGDWAEILLNIRNVAVKFDSPAHIVEMWHNAGVEGFLDAFLGPYKDKLCNGVAYESLVTDGLYRAHQLAMATDWDSFEMKNIGGLEFPVDVEFPDEPMEDF